MNINARIRKALKRETGIHLSAVEVRRIANDLGIESDVRRVAKRTLLKHSGGESKPAVEVNIRWMIRRDLTTVIAIENDANVDRGWSEAEFIKCLRQPHTIGMVAEQDETVVGFMIYELHKYKIVIHRLIVRKDMRRRSVGKQMIDKIVGKLSLQQRNVIRMDVPESITGGLIFLRSQNFVATAIRSDVEELIVMEYDVNGRQKFRGRTSAIVAAESEWQADNEGNDNVVL